MATKTIDELKAIVVACVRSYGPYIHYGTYRNGFLLDLKFHAAKHGLTNCDKEDWRTISDLVFNLPESVFIDDKRQPHIVEYYDALNAMVHLANNRLSFWAGSNRKGFDEAEKQYQLAVIRYNKAADLPMVWG